MATNGFYFFYCISFRTAAGKLACRDAQTLDGATDMSTQAYAPECECLSGLRECDVRSNPQYHGDREEGLFLFNSAESVKKTDVFWYN